jgi:hypothetical protein
MTSHDPKTCNLCAMGRHPALAAETAQLKKHLSKSPLPQQKGKST